MTAPVRRPDPWAALAGARVRADPVVPWTALLAIQAFVVESQVAGWVGDRTIVWFPLLGLPAAYLAVINGWWGSRLLRPPTAAVLAFLAWSLVTAAWSVDPLLTATQTLSMLFIFLCGAGVTAIVGIRRAVFGLAAGLSASAALGLVVGIHVFPDRVAGLASHPNVFAQSSVYALLGWMAWHRLDSRWTRWHTTGVAVSGLALLASQSRTSLLAVVAAWVLVGAEDRLRAAGWALAGLGGLAALTLLTGLGDRLSNTDDTASFNGRTEIWAAAGDYLAERPWTGWGAAAHDALWFGIQQGDTLSFQVSSAHNLWIHLALSTGLVGVGLLVAVVPVAWWCSIGRSRRLGPALLVAILVLGISEPVFHVASIVWMAVGMAVVEAAADDEERAGHPA